MSDQAQNQTPANNPKSNGRRKWPWLLGGLAIIFAVTISCSDDQQAATNNNGSDTTAQNEQPQQQAPPEQEQAEAGIGQPVRDGKFEFTVEGIERASSVGDDAVMTEEAQGEFAILTVTVENIGNEAQPLSDADQYVYDASGRQYSTDSMAALSIMGNDVLFNPINPGNSVTGKLVFDVPPGTELTSAELHDSAFSNGVTVSLE
ncbi:hypothetical protein FHU38_005408 [Saccharomonospora amisosensis]|uniref:DUF4352 domain-containing protein n=1 Tax=Saccharomonospora amisosensis TaxID=1128677 RepID=A0A7X5UVL8_9PSEU|nr:DUF4352 domain-containing protein [Saccharomonospora amisosensis]NIJ15000.1 hypothetical protein [Saccharomonospora amisosensis]